MSKATTSNVLPGPTRILIHIFFILFCMACLLPIMLMISVSLTDEQSLLTKGYQFIPQKFSSLAYQFLLGDGEVVLRAYGVTITVTLIGASLHVLLTALYAYPLSRRDFPFRNFFVIFILITMLFSGGLVPFYLVYTKLLDLRDNLWALILPGVIGPFNIFLVRTFFQQNIPVEILDSAKLDGAGELRIFTRMILPLSLPVLATIGLFTTIGYWNNWFNALLFISDKDLYTLQYIMMQSLLRLQFLQEQMLQVGKQDLVKQLASQVPSESIRMAMVIIATGPLILAYPFFQRFFIQGMTVGSIKG